MNKIIKFVIFLVLTVLTFSMEQEKTDKDKEFIKSNFSTSFNMLQSIQKGKDGENILFSPMGAYLNLLMLYNGSEGDTKKELEFFLNLSNTNDSDLNDFYRTFLNSLGKTESKVIKNEFVERLKKEIAECEESKNEIENNKKKEGKYYITVQGYESIISNKKKFIEQLEKSAAPTVQKNSEVEIKISTSIWLNNYNCKEEYKKILNDSYNAELKNLDFSDSKTRKVINDWVTEKTRGKITNVIDRIDSGSAMMLFNVIYFYDEWLEKFDEKNTYKLDFFLSDKKKKQVDYMTKTGSYFNYYANDRFSTLVMPYKFTDVSAYFIIPSTESDISNFITTFTASDIENMKFWNAKCNIYIPKFKIEKDLDLKNEFINMGLNNIFSPKANFGKIDNTNAFIGELKQKSMIELDENGTKIVSVTYNSRLKGIEPKEKPIIFKLDRPFLYMLRENKTGMILFFAKVMDPNPLAELIDVKIGETPYNKTEENFEPQIQSNRIIVNPSEKK